MSLHIVILAAGQGKRMQSQKAKTLHEIAGKPMLSRVIETAQTLNPEAIHVIIGSNGQQIQDTLADLPVHWVKQEQQLGTGHALMQAMPSVPETADVLVLSADVPLIQSDTLKKLINAGSKPSSLRLLLAKLDNPQGLGRIIRDNSGSVQAIVEEKDASDTQKTIKEIYSGICCAPAKDLERWLPLLSSHNGQEEYYLTEVIHLAAEENHSIASIEAEDPIEIQGVNTRLQLQQLERAWQTHIAEQLLSQGVSLADSARIDVRGELRCEQDVFIDVNCVFQGRVTLAKGCVVEPNCLLKNVSLGENTIVHANSVLEDCEIDQDCQLGPFARIRPGTKLEAKCKIGNFVETKNAYFKTGTKANHLSYLGDVTLGQNVNIGAGTITCNYDGVNKYQTVIEDNVFIGSDTQLVAPVTVGANATIGAGSTIRKDVPPNELTISISRQKTIYGWRRGKKK